MVSASATVAMRITGATAHPVRRWSLSFPAHLFSFCRAITHSHNNLSAHKAALVAAVLRRWQ
jgi:hypothetical protein